MIVPLECSPEYRLVFVLKNILIRKMFEEFIKDWPRDVELPQQPRTLILMRDFDRRNRKKR